MTEDKGILIRNIYYMLAYAFQELRQNNYAEIEGESFEEIYDLFAEILSRGISFQLKQGLYREYVARNESMQTVRGKIDMHGTIAMRMRNNQQVVCDYDELSEDNIFNQILVTTAFVLLKHSNVKKEKKAQLKKLMLFFQNVHPIDVHAIRWNSLRFDRNNKNYRMLLYICYFIISEWLMTTDEGKFKLREFSDDHMCRLFEKFVLEYYKKHHPETKASAAQIGWNIVEEATDSSVLPIMQTDVLLSLGERTLIIDTKYYSKVMQEQYDKKTLRSNHLYQISTYVNEYDSEALHNVDGMVLYAKTKQDDLEDAQVVKKAGYTLFFRTLDLNTDFEAIKKRLDSFIQSAENNKMTMPEQGLPKFFRFYKGEKDNPFDGKDQNKAALWDCERSWNFDNMTNAGRQILTEYIGELASVGLAQFEKYDDIPVSYKALLFVRFAKTDYSLTDAVEPFKKLYAEYYN